VVGSLFVILDTHLESCSIIIYTAKTCLQ